ncbi:hypothetical protein HY450_03875 [Candidatus Pacearchaeota archaeon]|nr:hypothetical protein [Candidatus Pacearchaeota archaeon]
MEKRGELTSTQIITILLTIIGFVVVVIFLLTILDFKNTSLDEVCRLSILTRATTPDALEKFIPLNCETKRYCLTTTGEDCVQFIGESNVEKVKLPSGTLENGKTKAAQKIEEISANAMFDCWSITGKGRLDISSGAVKNPTNILTDIYSVDGAKPICLVCSRIAIADDLAKREDILKDVNVNDYFGKQKVPGSDLTYLQTLTDKQINSYPAAFTQELGKSSPKTTNEIAIIFTQIITDDKAPILQAIEKGTNTGVSTAGGILLGPTGAISPLKTLGLSAIAGIVSSTISGGIAYVKAKENQGLAITHCDKLTSPEKERYGCSVIAPIDYNEVETINQLCYKIEGTPSAGGSSLGAGGEFGGTT